MEEVHLLVANLKQAFGPPIQTLSYDAVSFFDEFFGDKTYWPADNVFPVLNFLL